MTVNLTIDGETIETTPEHPFYTLERGWIAATALQLGEHVLNLEGGYGIVEAVEALQQPQVMYNLSVEGAHTFFVGEGSWLVHNKNKKCMFHVRKGDNDIWYGPLDEHGRPTGVFARLQGLEEGSKIGKTWKPPEFDRDTLDRTHLLARDFGGGGMPQNRVLTYWDVNQEQIDAIEDQVRDALDNGEVVIYGILPVFPKGSSTILPERIVLQAYGTKGTKIYEAIPNVWSGRKRP